MSVSRQVLQAIQQTRFQPAKTFHQADLRSRAFLNHLETMESYLEAHEQDSIDQIRASFEHYVTLSRQYTTDRLANTTPDPEITTQRLQVQTTLEDALED